MKTTLFLICGALALSALTVRADDSDPNHLSANGFCRDELGVLPSICAKKAKNEAIQNLTDACTDLFKEKGKVGTIDPKTLDASADCDGCDMSTLDPICVAVGKECNGFAEGECVDASTLPAASN